MKSTPLSAHQILPGEEFRVVDGYPRYLVSNLARVYSTIRAGRFLRQTISPQGYPYVSLMDGNGKPTKLLVHRLVAEAFVPRIQGADVINHKDGDKENNLPGNLEWCTYSHNNEHALETGLSRSYGETHYAALLTEEEVRQIRLRARRGEYHRDIASAFGIARQTVTKIVGGKAWRRAA